MKNADQTRTVSLPARGGVLLVRLYQAAVSPLLPPACRFEPSCSEYTCGALLAHGFSRGAWLAVKRLLRCHPFHGGGLDPVPERKRF